MKNIKELLLEIKDMRKEGKAFGVLAYNKNWELGGLYQSDALVPNNYRIANLKLDNNMLEVEGNEEINKIVEAFKELDDIGRISYTMKRVDAYYKNGRKAIAILNSQYR